MSNPEQAGPDTDVELRGKKLLTRRRILLGATAAVMLGGGFWAAGELPEPDLDDVLPDPHLLPVVPENQLPRGAREAANQVFAQLHTPVPEQRRLDSPHNGSRVVEQRVFFLDYRPPGPQADYPGAQLVQLPPFLKYDHDPRSTRTAISFFDRLERYGYTEPGPLLPLPFITGGRPNAVMTLPPTARTPPIQAVRSSYTPRIGSSPNFELVQLRADLSYEPDGHPDEPKRLKNAKDFQERFGKYEVWGFFKSKRS